MTYTRYSLLLATTLTLFGTACQTTPPVSAPAANPSLAPSQTPMPSNAAPAAPTITTPTQPMASPVTQTPPTPSSQPSAAPADPALVAPIASLEIQADSRFLERPGSNRQLRVSAKDAQGNPVAIDPAQLQWRSSRPQDVSVSANGLAQALESFGYSMISVQWGTLSAQLLISVSGGEAGGSFGSAPDTRPSVSGSISGSVGDTITLQGRNLSNIRSITLDGTPVNFSVTRQGVQIVVPGGAVTGKLVITTAGGQGQSTFTLRNRAWLVDRDAKGANNGSTWSNAFTTLQAALAVARSGDQIWIAEGKYTPASSDRAAYFNVPAAVTLYGGFAGTENYVSDRDVSRYESILSGDLSDNDEYGSVPGTHMDENSLNVVRHGANATLDGIVIEGGYADHTVDLDSPRGAGIYSGANPLTLRNSIVRNNYSADRAGGWYTEASGTLTVENSQFLNNIATGRTSSSGGGGLYHNSSDPNSLLQLNHVRFIGNSASALGGGALVSAGSLTLQQSEFSNNSGSGGGGLYVGAQGAVTLTDTTFTGNTATGGEGGGAAIGSSSLTLKPSLTLKQSMFSNNSSGGNGGGLNAHAITATLDTVRFVNNSSNALSGGGGGGYGYSIGGGGAFLSVDDSLSATDTHWINNRTNRQPGGGLFAITHHSSFTRTYVVGNTGTERGGGFRLISRSDGTHTLTHGVFHNNTIANRGQGGGLHFEGNNPTSLALNHITFGDNRASDGRAFFSNHPTTLRNSLVWDRNTNTPPIGLLSGVSLTALYSVVSGLSGYTLTPESTGNSALDPLFIDADTPLGADNTLGTSDDGLALQANSPALDLDISGVVLFPTDILGRSRSGNPDAGAYERP